MTLYLASFPGGIIIVEVVDMRNVFEMGTLSECILGTDMFRVGRLRTSGQPRRAEVFIYSFSWLLFAYTVPAAWRNASVNTLTNHGGSITFKQKKTDGPITRHRSYVVQRDFPPPLHFFDSV